MNRDFTRACICSAWPLPRFEPISTQRTRLMFPGWPFSILLALATACSRAPEAHAPAGLAAAALGDPAFAWIRRSIPGFRVYFLADSYPAAHQNALLEGLPPALSRTQRMIQAAKTDAPIDVFYIESRAQMKALTGARATGFAEPATRTVLLVSNPDWRPFERHEIMHVISRDTWGAPAAGNEWLDEGLAQAADGLCGGYSNTDVAVALAARHGWIPLNTLLTKFRAQPDLRAYLQAAAFAEYLLQRYGSAEVARLWRQGSHGDSPVGGETLGTVEARWRRKLGARRQLTPRTLSALESKGCG